MDKYPHLSKAPITEALIDIQVKLSEDFDYTSLDFHERIKDEYPQKALLRKFEGKFDFTAEKPSSELSQTKGGFKYTSNDNLYLLQTRIDGFTLSRLKQYETWEKFREEGSKLWKLYKATTNPFVSRVALRYINKFIIPLPIMDFGDYFTAPPVVPENLPQGISSFFSRVVIHEPKIKAVAIITHSVEPISSKDSVPIILDIDVFRIKNEGFEEGEVWAVLDNLKDFKNRIFYNSITNELLEDLK